MPKQKKIRGRKAVKSINRSQSKQLEALELEEIGSLKGRVKATKGGPLSKLSKKKLKAKAEEKEKKKPVPLYKKRFMPF